MPVLKRLALSPPPSVAGGPPAPCDALVELGPNFGPGIANDNGVSAIGRAALAITTVSPRATMTGRAALALTTLRFETATPKGRAALAFATATFTTATPSGRAALAIPTIRFVTEIPQGQAALATDTVKMTTATPTGRAQLQGTALGAPFYARTSAVTNQGVGGVNNVSTGSLASNIQDGDLILVFTDATGGVAVSWDTHADFTQIDEVDGAAVTAIAAAAYWKIWHTGDPTTYTFTVTATSDPTDVTCETHVIRGVDQTTPIDTFDRAGATAADPNPPAITTTVVNTLVVAHAGHAHAAVAETNTAPAGYAERDDINSTSASTKLGATSATKYVATATAEDPAVFNCSQVAGLAYIAWTVAVAPGPVTLL